jgi:hypothetical protein
MKALAFRRIIEPAHGKFGCFLFFKQRASVQWSDGYTIAPRLPASNDRITNLTTATKDSLTVVLIEWYSCQTD